MQLLGHAGAALPYLGFGHDELRDEAQRIPRQLHEEAFVPDAEPADYAARMVAAAERRFGEPVPGQTRDAQLARVLDAGYWRRFLVRRVREAREHLSLKLGLVGAGARQYCSDAAREQRRTQLQNQEKWLNETMLRAVIDGETVEIPMVQVVKGAHQKLSRLYAFIAAMDRLAVDADLTVALLTTTLEGEWHANPQHASKSHRWNGATPAEANRELGQRFQSIRRDLDKQGICLSGLWAGEPHQDGCPHRHHWLLYDPQHERAVFAAFLRYFPAKLKLRRDERAGGDAIIETREDALRGLRRPLTHAKEGAQVDVSIIDREKGSGASYVLKYVMKAVLSEASYVDLVRTVGSRTCEHERRAEQRADARREGGAQATAHAAEHRRAPLDLAHAQLPVLRHPRLPEPVGRAAAHQGAAAGAQAARTVAPGARRRGSRAACSAGEQKRRRLRVPEGAGRPGGGSSAPEQLELGDPAGKRRRAGAMYTETTVTRYGETGRASRASSWCSAGGNAGRRLRAGARGDAHGALGAGAEVLDQGETTEGKVSAAAPGKAKTAKASHRPPAEAGGDS